jgi:hypothetical protein
MLSAEHRSASGAGPLALELANAEAGPYLRLVPNASELAARDLFRSRSSLCSAKLASPAPPRACVPVCKSVISVSSSVFANSAIKAKSSAHPKAVCWRPSRCRWWRNPVGRGSRRGETCLPVQAGPRAEARIRIRLIRPAHQPRRESQYSGRGFLLAPIQPDRFLS